MPKETAGQARSRFSRCRAETDPSERQKRLDLGHIENRLTRPQREQIRRFGPLFATVRPRLRQSALPLLQRFSDIVLLRGNHNASAKGIRQPPSPTASVTTR